MRRELEWTSWEGLADMKWSDDVFSSSPPHKCCTSLALREKAQTVPMSAQEKLEAQESVHLRNDSSLTYCWFQGKPPHFNHFKLCSDHPTNTRSQKCEHFLFSTWQTNCPTPALPPLAFHLWLQYKELIWDERSDALSKVRGFYFLFFLIIQVKKMVQSIPERPKEGFEK